MRELTDIIDATIKAVEDMKRSGITHVAVSRETLDELGKPIVRAVTAAVAAPDNSNVAAELALIQGRAKVCVKCRNWPVAGTASSSASATRAPN